MKKNLKRALILALVLVTVVLFTGCAKENKYVNVGVEMSTAGMSLYLTNTVQGFQKISTYVFFSPSSEDSLERVRMNKQGIDITYLPVKDLGMIGSEDRLKVVLIDCFEESGDIRGVWVANGSWLENAPNYSYRFILGLVMSQDYRASHMNMSYSDALESVKGLWDVDWEKFPETMQYCAVYAVSNKEELRDEPFIALDVKTMLSLFEGFDTKTGEGYEACKRAYDSYCDSGSLPFEQMFDLSLMQRALEEASKTE